MTSRSGQRKRHRDAAAALLAIMFGVLLFVTYVPASFMWLPRMFGFAR